MRGEFRLRVRYAKRGRLRWLSHLEVVRSLERCVRRAGVPYAVTHGFNPHMKIAYGPALPVGTAGLRECFDVWLTRYNDAGAVLSLLQENSTADLAPEVARYVADTLPSLSSGVVVGLYDVEVREEGITAQVVEEALGEALAIGVFRTEHRGKTKLFDLAECLPKGAEVTSIEDGVAIRMPIRIGQHGALRPDVFIRGTLPHDAGPGAVVVTRSDTLVEGEDGAWTRPV